MSWDIDLCDPVTKEVITVPYKHFMFGANVEVGGSNVLTTNITYNYNSIINGKFDQTLNDLGITLCGQSYAHYIEGKSGTETIPILKGTIEKLGDDVDDYYWKATEGNAKRALNILLAFAQMRPDGIWQVY